MAQRCCTKQRILDYLATCGATTDTATTEMAAIAEAIGRSPSTVSRHLADLRVNNLVTVEYSDTGHRPKHQHALTDAGRAAATDSVSTDAAATEHACS